MDVTLDKVALQQEEVSSLDRKLEQRREDERLLLDSVEQRRQSLAEVLRHGEQEARELQRHIKVDTLTPGVILLLHVVWQYFKEMIA